MKTTWLKWINEKVHSLGPYLLIDLLLPGGSIIALVTWLYRHRTLHHTKEKELA